MAEDERVSAKKMTTKKKKKKNRKKIRQKRRNLSKLAFKSLFSEDEALNFLNNRLADTHASEQKSQAALQTKAARQLMYLQSSFLASEHRSKNQTSENFPENAPASMVSKSDPSSGENQWNFLDADAIHCSVPARTISQFRQKFRPLTSSLAEAHTSDDGATTKLLIRLQDGYTVEAVIMRHVQRDKRGLSTTPKPKEEGGASGRKHSSRVTLCVSSQVGCRMGCRFCATGTLGDLGNLSAGEIVEQLLIANRVECDRDNSNAKRDKRGYIRNVVFMGMGEPLNNYGNVVLAAKAMTDPRRFGLSPSRVTVSTVGVVPRMLQLTRDMPKIALALSLHAPNQQLREQIIPSAKAYPLSSLMSALRKHFSSASKRNRCVLLQYILLKDVNDTPGVAHELGRLLKPLVGNIKLNLIPYNPNYAAGIEAFDPPDTLTALAFQHILRKEYGVFTTMRIEMGQDVFGACGQLALINKTKGGQPDTQEEGKAAPVSSIDIEDLSNPPSSRQRSRTAKKRIKRRTVSDTSNSHPGVKSDDPGTKKSLTSKHDPLSNTRLGNVLNWKSVLMLILLVCIITSCIITLFLLFRTK